ncbi:MAG: PEP-CTERM sorting domain-containing protein [Herbaspirillum sp.]|nr:PEP-CTERM sorting domain-containing protein [Herbaspirillum sp.]
MSKFTATHRPIFQRLRALSISTLAVAVLGLASAASASATPVNLVTNGNFDANNVGNGWSSFANGSVPGWTNTRNNDGIEIDHSAILGGAAYTGTTQSAELNGGTWDTISQTITGLTVGQTYVLSWAYGQRPGSGRQQADITFGGNLVTSNFSSGGADFLTWTFNTFNVVATSTTEVLSFAAVAGLGNPSVGNEITAVSLTASDVPEPASLLLLSTGLLGLGFARRKKA